jgi:membrane protease YdiL (CAAX protease family)
MSDLETAKSARPVSQQPSRTWDFMETLFVVLIADGVFVLTSGIALTVLIHARPGVASMSWAQLHALWSQGNMLGAGLIAGSPPTIAVLWIAIRQARRGFAEYLALNWPSPSEVLYAFAVMAIVLAVETAVSATVGRTAGQTAPYLVVKSTGGLFILMIGGCIAGPLMEEFVVRGFMFRGWSESFLGPIGAIVLTSAVWAMNHTQYDWFGQLEIFGMGLALGHFRWRSNSTWLTVMVHSAVNTFLFFTAGPYT